MFPTRFEYLFIFYRVFDQKCSVIYIALDFDLIISFSVIALFSIFQLFFVISIRGILARTNSNILKGNRDDLSFYFNFVSYSVTYHYLTCYIFVHDYNYFQKVDFYPEVF